MGVESRPALDADDVSRSAESLECLEDKEINDSIGKGR